MTDQATTIPRMNDISPDWTGSTRREQRVIMAIEQLEETPKAIARFARDQAELGDYWYWFLLGTLWVSYSAESDLDQWRTLFSSKRPNRRTSLMKPSETRTFDRFPNAVTALRAHRLVEADWISYTLHTPTAARFAVERGVGQVAAYRINRDDILALFLRRGEFEIIVLDKTKASFIRNVPVHKTEHEDA